MAGKRKPTEIKLEVLETIGEYEVDETHKVIARVVSWNDNPPIFEIRPIKRRADGGWNNGQHILKCKPEFIPTAIEWLENARSHFFSDNGDLKEPVNDE